MQAARAGRRAARRMPAATAAASPDGDEGGALSPQPPVSLWWTFAKQLCCNLYESSFAFPCTCHTAEPQARGLGQPGRSCPIRRPSSNCSISTWPSDATQCSTCSHSISRGGRGAAACRSFEEEGSPGGSAEGADHVRRCLLGCRLAHGIAFAAGHTNSGSPGACRAALQAEPSRHSNVEAEEQVSSAHGCPAWICCFSAAWHAGQAAGPTILLLHVLPSFLLLP